MINRDGKLGEKERPNKSKHYKNQIETEFPHFRTHAGPLRNQPLRDLFRINVSPS
jgi:hypothetical protein